MVTSREIANPEDRNLDGGSAAEPNVDTHRMKVTWLVIVVTSCLTVVMDNAQPASAQGEPPGCKIVDPAGYFVAFPDEAMHGEEVCVKVLVSNSCGGACCNVTANAELTLPGGAIVPVLSNAMILEYDSVFCPSSDPRCLTASNCTIAGVDGYSFIIKHGHEHGENGRACPAAPQPGMGREHISLEINGVGHTGWDDQWSRCKCGPIKVNHRPCTNSCDQGEVCAQGICVPPTCDGNGVCDPDENCESCPSDCTETGSGCGNGICEPRLGENCINCSADCNGKRVGKASGQFCCGAGNREISTGCDDNRCSSRGFECTTEGVPPCCGNGSCGEFEDSCNCPSDCGRALDHEGQGQTCTDGIDNDCDGDADGADLDCSCGLPGRSCVANADCCSNICTSRGLCR